MRATNCDNIRFLIANETIFHEFDIQNGIIAIPIAVPVKLTELCKMSEYYIRLL